MATTINLKRLLHKKSPELCNPLLNNTAAGSFVSTFKNSTYLSPKIFYVASASSCWIYYPDEDAWMQLPNSGIAGTFAAGSCGDARMLSAPGGNQTNTATGGTTTTINTGLTINGSAANVKIRVIAGSGVGYEGTISSNTYGTNSILTVTPASGVTFSATTQYQIFGGSLWFWNAGTVAVGFSVYDRLTNAWTSRSVAGMPTAWGTDAQLISTGSAVSGGGNGFVTGTAASGAASTITLEAGKTFLLNQWTNSQIRITAGTGIGQIRTISSNTAGASPVVTVSAAWTVQPDATSQYIIEGNDDFMYLGGNNAVTLYKYTISTNTWSTLAPTAARAGAAAAGSTFDWIDNVTQSNWTDGTYANHYLTTLVKQNGRYIYSFRGGGANTLDVYDIAANTWISNVLYRGQMETFTTGSCSFDYKGEIFIQKDATGRIFKFKVAEHDMDPLIVNPLPQSTAVVGDKMAVVLYQDGATVLPYIYTAVNSNNYWVRWIVF